ncbi:putative glycerol-3-phosphate acyltransferase Sct1 [Microthyrium microscopicum]|uniref:Putative glycerol-3-phosphate acyltransferase Sct1 n=1 Tax=Microthyrium microscopicum TaxID=703497 RepID=A0A6A6UU23_9PEZI|nr:putative glycerol-3-phosphate acyltransferase Sct1 [Microthyrium microscopicum]
MNPFVYDIIVWIINIILDLFFREVHPRGSWRIPREGPVIFVAAPHANQFVDPILLMRVIRREAKRRVAFLTAAASMNRPFVGFMARQVGSVPVSRPQDMTKPMVGKIYLPDPDNDPLLVRGYGTNFEDPKVQEGGLLMLPTVHNEAANAEIAEVKGPEELRLKKPFYGTTAMNQLTGRDRVIPDGKHEEDVPKQFEGTPFKIAPKVDQTGVYHFVTEVLGANGCIGMFPEGGSHDRSELLPLKAGVAIMALEALAKYPDCGLKVVPCGMNYFHAHKFRSRAVLEFGAPVQISREDIESYKKGERRGAIGKTLLMIHAALKTVTINTPDYDTLMFIQAVRRLYKPKGSKITLPQVVELNRRLIEAYAAYKDDARITTLKRSVGEYNGQLLSLQIRDHQVEYAKMPYHKAIWLLVSRLVRLGLMSILVIPGLVLFAPIFILGKLISLKKAKAALAASSVKIEAKDVLATWKLLVSLAAAPAFYVFYTIILSTWYSINQVNGLIFRGIPLSIFIPLAFFFFACMSYAALRLGEVGMDMVKSLRPLLIALSPMHGSQLAALRERRQELANQVTELINTLGPEFYPNFEKKRLIHPDNFTTADDEDSSEEYGTPSEPATPTSPGFNSYHMFGNYYGDHSRHLPRNESLHNISNIGMFSSRPVTPRGPRSRSGSFGGDNNPFNGFSPLSSHGKQKEFHKNVQNSLRERGKRRKSEGGSGWNSGTSTPNSEYDGLSMSPMGKKKA